MIGVDRTEGRDLLVAWLALGVAFTFFIGTPAIVTEPQAFVTLFLACLVTAGAGFLAHELAHKVVAIRYGREAAFRADYRLLVVAILSGLAGFLFAAPGAVHHRGPPDERIHGLVAVAGPLTNLALVVGFLPAWRWGGGALATVGALGIWINALLAAFNMLPVDPLDGATVRRWHLGVYVVTFLVCAGVLAWTLLVQGLVPW